VSDIAHLIWLIAAAVVVAGVLTIGTLAAADLLPRSRREDDREVQHERRTARPIRGSDQGAPGR
jgi:hypothetical protein